MKPKLLFAALSLTAMLATVSCNKQDEGPIREAVSHKDDYQQAYIYGFPMIAGYKAMYQFAIDKSNSQFKAPLNLYGGRAMDVKQYLKWKERVILGASLHVAAPTGQYDPTKLINWGINRWAFKFNHGQIQRTFI